MSSHFKFYSGWFFTFVWIFISLFLIAYNHDLKKNIEYQKTCIFNLRNKNLKLEENQRNLDWLESHLKEIDEYIKWKDILIIKGAEYVPAVIRTPEQMNEARLEVILSAVEMAEKKEF